MKDSSSELSKSDKGKAISETGYDFIKAAQFIGIALSFPNLMI